jgi:hypothetical protein
VRERLERIQPAAFLKRRGTIRSAAFFFYFPDPSYEQAKLDSN